MEKFIGSIDHNLSPELVAELKARDKETKKRQWANFEEKLEAPNKKEIVEAFKELHSIYDEGLIKWMANLYDPDICVCNELYGKTECEHHPLCGTAGFHYTHSARDNVGYLPVVEAMNSIYDFVESCGLTDYDHVNEWFGKEHGNKMMNFVENLQDPDGFFYHPQWGKNIGIGRRCRDYDRALILLGRYGRKTKYPTMRDAEESGGELLIPDNMKTLEAFKEYLATLDIDHRSYHVGSVLSEQVSTLKTRGPEYCQALLDFLDSHQREDNGIWNEKCDYYGSNGLMKIAGAYTKLGKPVPNPEKAIKAAVAAIMSPENPDTIVTVWNPWVSVKRLLINFEEYYSPELAKKMRDELYKIAPEAIRITKEKTLKFKHPDGSFSYLPGLATWTMQGAPCGVPRTAEGDMDAAVLGTNSMVWVISDALGVEEKDGVPLYGEYESAVFKNIMDNRKPVRKV
ncbi:MAG: hypothetical protein IKJ13_06590 [Clostridia bacterium]|nr:hypothetical protein [Clostridia bacterium]